MESVNCILCGTEASRAKPYRLAEDRYTGKHYLLVRCSVCGLVYLNPRPAMEELLVHYPETYEPYQNTREEIIAGSGGLVQHERADIRMQLDYVERYLPQRGRLLDVGCANGRFMFAAKQRGWETLGVEISSSASEAARELYGLNVFTGTLEKASYSIQSFDAITLWDVLEHVPSPVETLRLCWKLLKPGGILAVSIPNLSSFDRYLFGTYWIGWDTPRHFTLFDGATLLKALNLTQFRILDQRCLFGGKGTFMLSTEIWINHLTPTWGIVIRKMLPAVLILTMPYRQFSYLLKRGPILFTLVRREDY